MGKIVDEINKWLAISLLFLALPIMAQSAFHDDQRHLIWIIPLALYSVLVTIYYIMRDSTEGERKELGNIFRQLLDKWELVSMFEMLGLLLFRAFVLITVLDYLLEAGMSLLFRLWIAFGGFLWMFKSGVGSTRRFIKEIQTSRNKSIVDNGE